MYTLIAHAVLILGVLLWELWTAAELPYAGLRNQQVTDQVKALVCQRNA